MRPRFWYCPLCGYMFMDRGRSGDSEDCPMCGEQVIPCWDCISTGVFEDSWCAGCIKKPDCLGKLRSDAEIG